MKLHPAIAAVKLHPAIAAVLTTALLLTITVAMMLVGAFVRHPLIALLALLLAAGLAGQLLIRALLRVERDSEHPFFDIR